MTDYDHDLRDPRLVWWPEGPPAHHYAFEEFSKTSYKRVSDAPDMPATMEPLPVAHPSCDRCLVVEPFPLPKHPEGYVMHATADWEIVTAEGVPVAIYRRNYGMRVHRDHQRRGIGLYMAVWRAERRGVAPPFPWQRNEATWAMQRPAHRLLLERALRRGAKVPDSAVADYPDLIQLRLELQKGAPQ